MDAVTLQRVMSDPVVFRQHLLIDTDAGPKPLAEVMDPWQARDFEALDSGWRAAAGQQIDAPRLRGWLERPRGHSKTQDLAVMLAWLLIAAKRSISAVAAAADRDQAALLRDAIRRLTLTNSWLAGLLDVQAYRVVNEHNGSVLEVLSADVASSFGINPNAIVVDEVVHHPGRGLWDSLLSSAAKRSNCLLLIASNCGWTNNWTYALHQQVEQDSRWYVSSLPGPCASWIGPEQLAEQERLLPPSAYRRLWLNVWVAESGDAISADDIAAAVTLPGPEETADGVSWYLAAVDRSLRRDNTAVVVVGVHPGGNQIRAVWVRSWKPSGVDPEADEREVERTIVEANGRFQPITVKFDPFAMDTIAYRCRRQRVPMSPCPFAGNNLDSMARAMMTAFKDRLVQVYNSPELLHDLGVLSITENRSGFGLRLTASRDESGHGDSAMALAEIMPAAVQIATLARPGALPPSRRLAVVGCTPGVARLPLHPDGSIDAVRAYQLQQRLRG